MNNRENLHHSNFRKCWHLWLKQKRWNSEFCENCEKVKLWKKWIFNFSQISSDDSGLGEIQNSEDEQTDSEVVILDDSGLKSDFSLSPLVITNRHESYHMAHTVWVIIPKSQNAKLKIHSSFVIWNFCWNFYF